jgi:hypothetical protein
MNEFCANEHILISDNEESDATEISNTNVSKAQGALSAWCTWKTWTVLLSVFYLITTIMLYDKYIMSPTEIKNTQKGYICNITNIDYEFSRDFIIDNIIYSEYTITRAHGYITRNRDTIIDMIGIVNDNTVLVKRDYILTDCWAVINKTCNNCIDYIAKYKYAIDDKFKPESILFFTMFITIVWISVIIATE